MVETKSPAYNIGPGEFIKEELEARHWRQEDLAAILAMSLKAVNEIIRSKQAITIETAQKLGMAFGQSPQFWLNLDNAYRLRERRQDYAIKDVGTRARIYEHMPIGEMIKRGWIKTAKPLDALVDEVKRFWNIDDLDFSFMDKAAQPMFRKSAARAQYNPNFAQTWFHMARRCASLFKVGPYHVDEVECLGTKMHKYTASAEGSAAFIQALNDAGVKFLVLGHLPKTYTDGAVFMDGKNPVIAYTGRYDRVDHFWFTVAHELAHLVLHFKKHNEMFIDRLDRLETVQEHAANHRAASWLKEREVLAYFKNITYKSRARVEDCACRFELHPAIVVGILQHNEQLAMTNLNQYKTPIAPCLPDAYWVEKRLSELRNAS